MIDSGISPSHDDLGPGRVVHWVDFVAISPSRTTTTGTARTSPESLRAPAWTRRRPARHRARCRPDRAQSLDGTGNGYISDVIAASTTRWRTASDSTSGCSTCRSQPASTSRTSQIRSPRPPSARSAPASSSSQPLATSARVRAATRSTAASAAPGNAPWVLTVGAADDKGTPDRADDVVAAFSSRGPAAIDGTRQAGSRRAGRGHRVRRGALEHAVTRFSLAPASGARRAP